MQVLESYAERVIRRLREEGLKITPQRIAIVKYLENNSSHPSVERIHRDVARNFPTISLATVYNTLDTLEKIEEVRPLMFCGKRKVYEPNMDSHHHVLCEECGAIHDIFSDYAAQLTIPGELIDQFEVRDTSVLFKGVCSGCT